MEAEGWAHGVGTQCGNSNYFEEVESILENMILGYSHPPLDCAVGPM